MTQVSALVIMAVRQQLSRQPPKHALQRCVCLLPLVLLPDEVLLGEVDQVYHGLGSDEEMLVQGLDLKKEKKKTLKG